MKHLKSLLAVVFIFFTLISPLFAQGDFLDPGAEDKGDKLRQAFTQDAQRTFRFNLSAYNQMMRRTWNNNDFTPQEVVSEMGTNATQLFTLGQILKNTILACAPDIPQISPYAQAPSGPYLLLAPLDTDYNLAPVLNEANQPTGALTLTRKETSVTVADDLETVMGTALQFSNLTENDPVGFKVKTIGASTLGTFTQVGGNLWKFTPSAVGTEDVPYTAERHKETIEGVIHLTVEETPTPEEPEPATPTGGE